LRTSGGRFFKPQAYRIGQDDHDYSTIGTWTTRRMESASPASLRHRTMNRTPKSPKNDADFSLREHDSSPSLALIAREAAFPLSADAVEKALDERREH
jgi:hypothetical protein